MKTPFSSTILAVALLVAAPSQAGLQINGKAARKSGQVQVFGKKKAAVEDEEVAPKNVTSDEADDEASATNDAASASAEDYAEMLKADRKRLQENEATDDREFESVRAKIHSRQAVAANTTDDEEEAPAPKKKAASSSGKKSSTKKTAPKSVAAKPAAKPAAKVAEPEMETETITPQKAIHGSSVTPPPPPGEGLGRSGGDVNPAFPYTHMLPSPFNIPQGTWVVGSTVAYGLLDFAQIETNTVRMFSKQWNFRLKVPLIEYPTFIASANLGYESYNPHSIADDNPDFRINRWQPGLTTGYELSESMAFFVGGNFNFGQDEVPVKTTSGVLHGAQIEGDWTWLYNPSGTKLGNNAISLGVTYDTTYSMFGFGFTHHWRILDLGLHYTFADRQRFMPILAFEATAVF